MSRKKEYLITVINNLAPHTSLDQPGSSIIDTPAFTHIITTRANVFQLLLLHERNRWLVEH